MKYICLGYLEPGKIEGMTEDERHATLDDALSTTTICAPTGIWLPKSPSACGDRVDPA
ncbi:MAG: hypothetical protein WBV69_06220 [Candidatus Sulfotelmatobacter sp.]